MRRRGAADPRAGHEELVARTGGDTFAVVCDDDRAEAVVAAAAAALERPVAIAGLEIDVRAVAGIAAAPADNAGTLLRQADVALRAAKERRAAGSAFEPAMTPAPPSGSPSRPSCGARSRPASSCCTTSPSSTSAPDCRPASRRSSAGTGRGTGSSPPDVFIGLAERTGLIRNLTTWVLERAVADQARWAAAGHRIAVAVNLSTRAIGRASSTTSSGCSPAAPGELELEITESAAMHDLEGSLAVLERLAALGVRLSVDDFGTGHSSLAYLERLPVAALKIDRAFVAGLEPGPRTAASSTRRSSSPTGSGSRSWPRASRTTPRSPSCARWAATSRRASASPGRCPRPTVATWADALAAGSAGRSLS